MTNRETPKTAGKNPVRTYLVKNRRSPLPPIRGNYVRQTDVQKNRGVPFAIRTFGRQQTTIPRFEYRGLSRNIRRRITVVAISTVRRYTDARERTPENRHRRSVSVLPSCGNRRPRFFSKRRRRAPRRTTTGAGRCLHSVRVRTVARGRISRKNER